MLDTLKIYEELKQVMDAPAAEKIAEVVGELHASVTSQWFNVVREGVTHLTDELSGFKAESRQEFSRLDTALTALAEAQKRTETRLEALAELQQRYQEENRQEFNRLDAALAALAEAQRRTETELMALVQSQKRLEEDGRDMRKQLGGLTATVGYTLENEAYKALPPLLERDYGLNIQGRLKRQHILDKQGQYIEVNIFGEAQRNGTMVVIVGESKSQLSKNEIDKFLRRKLDRLVGVYPHLFPLLVTHMISEREVEEYARQKGVALYYSYDF